MIRIFPVAAPTTVANSFGEDRGGRPHQGNDLFSSLGSPLVAVDDGQLRSGTDPLGGNIVNLYATDGTRYYYAHLNAFAGPDGGQVGFAPAPRQVRAGDVVGFLGKTGNAATTQPHLHFETHPGNGPAIDPFPTLVAAPRVPPNQQPGAPAAGPNPFLVALGIGLATTAIWSFVYPAEADALVARLRRTFV